MASPPDFVGVGTPYAGAGWWHDLLLLHPQIRPPRAEAKELHFFDELCRREMTDADVARYHEHFPREDGTITGEWTPRYMHDFWTPRLIRRAAPDAKLLVLFRDPIERFRSGVPKEIAVDRTRPLDWVIADAMERGRYASQLRRLRSEHPGAEILVSQYEKCVADPVAEYRRTLQFLGADADHPPPDFQRRRGRSQAKRKTPLWPDLLDGMRAMLEPEVRELAAMEPGIDVSLWPNFAHLAGAARAGVPDALRA